MSDSKKISEMFSDADSLNAKGHEAFQKGNLEELRTYVDKAIEIYTQILEQEPENAKAHYLLGNKFYEREDYSNSLSAYDKAIGRLSKDDELMIDVQINRTGTLCELKRYDEAINGCRQIMDTYKNHEDFEDIQTSCNWIINNCKERMKNS